MESLESWGQSVGLYSCDMLGCGWSGGVVLMVLLLLALFPWWKIWQRTGHSGWWALLMVIPLANLISLWVLAFKEWPALRGRS